MRLSGLSKVFLGFVVLSSSTNLHFAFLRRVSIKPTIWPRGTTWQSASTFNPAVVLHNSKFVMLYRAQDQNGISRLGYAESSDGIHFARRPEPVLSPETDYEKDGGVEDHGWSNSATCIT